MIDYKCRGDRVKARAIKIQIRRTRRLPLKREVWEIIPGHELNKGCIFVLKGSSTFVSYKTLCLITSITPVNAHSTQFVFNQNFILQSLEKNGWAKRTLDDFLQKKKQCMLLERVGNVLKLVSGIPHTGRRQESGGWVREGWDHQVRARLDLRQGSYATLKENQYLKNRI